MYVSGGVPAAVIVFTFWSISVMAPGARMTSTAMPGWDCSKAGRNSCCSLPRYEESNQLNHCRVTLALATPVLTMPTVGVAAGAVAVVLADAAAELLVVATLLAAVVADWLVTAADDWLVDAAVTAALVVAGAAELADAVEAVGAVDVASAAAAEVAVAVFAGLPHAARPMLASPRPRLARTKRLE